MGSESPAERNGALSTPTPPPLPPPRASPARADADDDRGGGGAVLLGGWAPVLHSNDRISREFPEQVWKAVLLGRTRTAPWSVFRAANGRKGARVLNNHKWATRQQHLCGFRSHGRSTVVRDREGATCLRSRGRGRLSSFRGHAWLSEPVPSNTGGLSPSGRACRRLVQATRKGRRRRHGLGLGKPVWTGTGAASWTESRAPGECGRVRA